MTLLEAISKADDLVPNTYPQADKLAWLSAAEARVRSATAGGDLMEAFTRQTPLDTLLGAPCPYDWLYVRYLLAQIHLLNGEIGQYNENITLYGAQFTDYVNWYRRSRMPRGAQIRYT